MENQGQAEGHGALCGAKKKQGPGTCRKTAGWGTDHPGYGPCRLHGGSTPTVARGAHLQQVEAQARKVLAKLGAEVNPVEDPLTALTRIAGEVLAWKDALGGLVNALTSLRYVTGSGEQLRAEVAAFERAMDRAIHVLSVLAKLNIEERLAKVSEKQIELVNAAITAALADAGLSEEVQEEVEDGFIRHLRLAAG